MIIKMQFQRHKKLLLKILSVLYFSIYYTVADTEISKLTIQKVQNISAALSVHITAENPASCFILTNTTISGKNIV